MPTNQPIVNELSEELKKFRSSTIQRNYTYLAGFIDNDLSTLIDSYQFMSITLPFIAFTKDVDGKMVYPIAFAKQEGDGQEIQLSLIGTSTGSVRTLVNTLASKIRNSNGMYNPPFKQKAVGIWLKVLDYSGHEVDTYQFRDLLYLGCEPVSWTYESQELVRYNLTLNADQILRNGKPYRG